MIATSDHKTLNTTQKYYCTNCFMTTHYSPFFLCVMSLVVLGCTVQQNDWKAENLNGQVRSYSEYSYEAESRFGEIKPGKRKRQNDLESDVQVFFDQQGNLTEKRKYNSAGELEHKFVYDYNDAGKRLRYQVFNSDNILFAQRLFQYDDVGREIGQHVYNPSGSLSHMFVIDHKEQEQNVKMTSMTTGGGLRQLEWFEYDVQGRKIQEQTYNSEGRLFKRYQTKYDEKGNTITERYTREDLIGNKFTSTTSYKYDSKGNRSEIHHFQSEKKGGKERLEWSEYYTYNEEGNLIETVVYDNDNILATSRYIYKPQKIVEIELGHQKKVLLYDNHGNMIEDQRYDNDNGNLHYKTTYEYDSNGNVIEEQGFDYGKLYYTATYEYDSNGNMIEEKRFKNGKLDYHRSYHNQYDSLNNLIQIESYESPWDKYNLQWVDASQGDDYFQHQYQKNGGLVFQSTFTLDDAGNMLEASQYQSNGDLNNKFSYRYNAKGEKTEENKYNTDGSLDYKITWRFDDSSNVLEEQVYNTDGSLEQKRTYQYEFDEKGNWLKKVVFEDGGAKFILVREYDYY